MKEVNARASLLVENKRLGIDQSTQQHQTCHASVRASRQMLSKPDLLGRLASLLLGALFPRCADKGRKLGEIDALLHEVVLFSVSLVSQ